MSRGIETSRDILQIDRNHFKLLLIVAIAVEFVTLAQHFGTEIEELNDVGHKPKGYNALCHRNAPRFNPSDIFYRLQIYAILRIVSPAGSPNLSSALIVNSSRIRCLQSTSLLCRLSGEYVTTSKQSSILLFFT